MYTTFLAQMWGPAILAVAIGIFVSRKYYIKVYRDLGKEALAVLLFGMLAIAGGIAQINYHNSWDTLPEIVVSILGWALLLKGILFTIFPKIVDRSGDWWVNNKLIPVAGGFALVVGIYLTWFGFSL